MGILKAHARGSGKRELRMRRHRRIRAKAHGSAQRPRLSVFRSHRHLTAQLIDDEAQRTIASASDRDIARLPQKRSVSRNLAVAELVGKAIAQHAREKGITRVVFDRGGFAYRGRVRALADGARKGGLQL